MKCHIDDCIDCTFLKFCKEGKILSLKNFKDIRKKIDDIDFETIALRAGLKKIVKKEFFTKEQYEDYLKSNQDLYIGFSNDNPEAKEKGFFGFIASTDESFTKRGNYLEDNMFDALIKKDFSLYKEGGKLLGYPDCCVDRFAKTSFARSLMKIKEGDIDTGYDLLTLRKTKNFFCPLLRMVSNAMLSFHVCSFDCPSAILFLQNTLNAVIQKYDIDLYLLFAYLKTPIVYFSNFDYINLVGYFEEGFVNYFDFIQIGDNSHDFDILKKGNKIKVEDDFLNVYRNEEIVGNIKINDFLLLNFGYQKKFSNLGKLENMIKKHF